MEFNLKLNNPFKKGITKDEKKEVSRLFVDLLRQNKGVYQHQLNELEEARSFRHDVDRPLTYLIQEMYEDAMLDSHLTAVIEKRILRVLNQQFIVKDEDKTVNEDLSEILEEPWFIDALRYAMESLFYGYNLLYIKDAEKGKIKELGIIPRDHIIPEKAWIIQNVSDTEKGFPYEEIPNFLIYAQLGTNAIGLLEKASPMAILKRHSWASWDEFEERFGLPLIIAKIAGNSKTKRKQVSSWLKSLARGAGGVFDVGDDIQVVSNGQSDSYKVFDAKKDAVNAELSKLILGQTQTTDGGSSYAQGKTHQSTEDEINRADIRSILGWINHTLLPVMMAHGYPMDGKRIGVLNEDDPEKLIKVHAPLLKAGYKFTKDYLEKTYGVELEDVKEEKPPKGKKQKLSKKEQEKLDEVKNFFA